MFEPKPNSITTDAVLPSSHTCTKPNVEPNPAYRRGKMLVLYS